MAVAEKKPATAVKADTKTPRQRFVEVGGMRVTKAVKAIRSLKNISVRKSYEYNEADTQKMFAALDNEVTAVKASFKAAMEGKTGATASEFSF